MKSNFYGQRQMNDASSSSSSSSMACNGTQFSWLSKYRNCGHFQVLLLAVAAVDPPLQCEQGAGEPLKVSVKLFNSSFDYFSAKIE